MQTFLPYADFKRSALCLDSKRRWCQVKESRQILDVLAGNYKGNAWSNHPAVNMWRGYVPALQQYSNVFLETVLELKTHNVKAYKIIDVVGEIVMPSWFGLEKFHASHRSKLLSKLPEYYGHFGWTEPDNLEYYWPV